jgi:hypothetical protein
VPQQVVDVGQASRKQLLVLASAIMQQPIGTHKDFCQTLTDMAAAVIHKCVYHLQHLNNKTNTITEFRFLRNFEKNLTVF